MSNQLMTIIAVMALILAAVFAFRYYQNKKRLLVEKAQTSFLEKVAYLAIRALYDTARRDEQILFPRPIFLDWETAELEQDAYALVNALMRNRRATYSWAVAVLRRYEEKQ